MDEDAHSLIRDGLPALSIRQPWAWLIAAGHKDIENRSWNTRLRGRFLIHAARTMTSYDYSAALATLRVRAVSRDFDIPASSTIDRRGGIVGVAEIVDSVTSSDSPWFFGEFGFVIRNAKPLPFAPCRGSLGFFRPVIQP